MDVQDELLSFNIISCVCAFISLINITLLLFHEFFAYTANHVEYNEDHRSDETDDGDMRRNNKENLELVKERRNSH